MEQNDLLVHEKITLEVIQKENNQQSRQQQQPQQQQHQHIQPQQLHMQQQPRLQVQMHQLPRQKMQQQSRLQMHQMQQQPRQLLQQQPQQKRTMDRKNNEEQRKLPKETKQSIKSYNIGKEEQESMDQKLGNENGGVGPRERLKRHRREVAGQVWIPDMWGQEDFLKDWIDCTSFDASLVPQNIMLARASLMEEGRRSNSHTLRVENSC